MVDRGDIQRNNAIKLSRLKVFDGGQRGTASIVDQNIDPPEPLGDAPDHAEYLGIPGKNILIEDKSRTTEEDAKFTKEILQKYKYKSLILVTAPYHSKRAASIFRKVMGTDIKIISAPVENSWFKFEDWWKRRRDRSMVLSEYSKFVWLWIFGVQEIAGTEQR